LTKNPALGFENMVGKTGLVVGPIQRKGTVRIGHELWQATARENIEKGAEIMVVSQIGLKLTVVKTKSSPELGMEQIH
jgi:membrane-bound ClpP family serine protease